ncbi:hypothetical protein BD413DRAFT_700017 [Trametes elegans]|nr:hypothetical protein BD413DRAFT_700017 [Trametes elegans]
MAQSDIPPYLFGPLQDFSGCAVIGFPLSTTVYGITVLQTYLYFRRYPEDSIYLKGLVSNSALDTLTIALITHAIYSYFVLDLGRYADLAVLPWSVSVEVFITDIITVTVQLFFAQQLYRISHGNKLLAGIIVFFTIPVMAVGLFSVVENFQIRLFPVTIPLVSALGGMQAAVALTGDILITGGLCYYFNHSRSGWASTNMLIDKLMVYAIQRGALTTIFQGVCLVTLVALPSRHIYVVFSMVVGKLYVNSLLASLNVRASLHRESLAQNKETSTVNFATQPTIPAPRTTQALSVASASSADSSNLELASRASMPSIQFRAPENTGNREQGSKPPTHYIDLRGMTQRFGTTPGFMASGE